MGRGIGSNLIETLCGAVGIEAPAGWVEYFEATQRWGSRTDLTAAKSEAELCEILFVDAAHLIAAGWAAAPRSMVDVGAGVGAPTLPLLLAAPDASATLVEPRRKRTAFLRSTIGSLGLAARASVLETRIDPDAPCVEGAPFDVALSRATFAPNQWLAIGSRIAREVWVLTAGVPVLGPPPSMKLQRQVEYVVTSTGAPRAAFAYAVP